MQTILERYKTLPDSNAVPDSVTDAHELEHAAARAVRDAQNARFDMAEKLRSDWSAKEIQTAGLSPVRNPRQVLADLLHYSESGEYSQAVFENMRHFIRELSCTLEPVFSALAAPEE